MEWNLLVLCTEYIQVTVPVGLSQEEGTGVILQEDRWVYKDTNIAIWHGVHVSTTDQSSNDDCTPSQVQVLRGISFDRKPSLPKPDNVSLY